MSSFISVIFTMELAVPNSTLNTTPINAVPATNTLAATTVSYNPAFQVLTSTTTIPLPNNPCLVVYIKNLDTSNILTITYTPVGGTSTSQILQPGGMFLSFNPSEAGGGGISSLTAIANSASINAEVFLGY